MQLYRLLTSQFPDLDELSVMAKMYAKFVDKYAKTPENADFLLEIGEQAPQSALDKIQVTALSIVANLIINHDATVIKRSAGDKKVNELNRRQFLKAASAAGLSGMSGLGLAE